MRRQDRTEVGTDGLLTESLNVVANEGDIRNLRKRSKRLSKTVRNIREAMPLHRKDAAAIQVLHITNCRVWWGGEGGLSVLYTSGARRQANVPQSARRPFQGLHR